MEMEFLNRNERQLFCELWMPCVQYSIYSTVSMLCKKKINQGISRRARGWICTRMIKAFKEVSLCQCLCAHGGREIGRCYSMFHVLFRIFFFFSVRVSLSVGSTLASSPPPLPLSSSAPNGQPGCIHWASRFGLCVYGSCTR